MGSVWGKICMHATYLRGKAADCLRLARGLSSHNPTRHHLIAMAARFESQAKQLEQAAAPDEPRETNSESNNSD